MSSIDFINEDKTLANFRYSNLALNSPPTSQPPHPFLLSNNSRMQSTTFHKFPELPPELRALIWKFAAPDPVAIIHRYSNMSRNFRKPPAVLHACQESRSQYLDSGPGPDGAPRRTSNALYKLYFQVRSPVSWLFDVPDPSLPQHQILKTTRGCYFSAEVDVFCQIITAGYRGETRFPPPPIASDLQHFAMQEGQYKMTANILREVFPVLKTFTCLFVPRRMGFGELADLPLEGNEALQLRIRQVDEEMLDHVGIEFLQDMEGELFKHPDWTPPKFTHRFTDEFLHEFGDQTKVSWFNMPPGFGDY